MVESEGEGKVEDVRRPPDEVVERCDAGVRRELSSGGGGQRAPARARSHSGEEARVRGRGGNRGRAGERHRGMPRAPRALAQLRREERPETTVRRCSDIRSVGNTTPNLFGASMHTRRAPPPLWQGNSGIGPRPQHVQQPQQPQQAQHALALVLGSWALSLPTTFIGPHPPPPPPPPLVHRSTPPKLTQQRWPRSTPRQ